MARLYIAAVCALLFIIGSFADKEYEHHGHDHHHHHHDHDGHDHHDHESHRKLFAGDDSDATEQEQMDKLRVLTSKIDTDKDGKVSRDEMHAYTMQRIKDQHAREADDFISTLDPNNTDKINFNAFIRENYGDMDMDELEKKDKSDTQSRETRRTYLSDKQKWAHLDKDGDQVLTHDDFRKFLRPEDHEDLRKIEINTIVDEYDDDKDGKISNAEYAKMTEAESGQADTLGDDLDTNKNGFAEYEEFARYYLPTSSTGTDEETKHLMNECDADKDGFCTADEIINAYSSFAGSQITDYGADLEEPRVEL